MHFVCSLESCGAAAPFREAQVTVAQVTVAQVTVAQVREAQVRQLRSGEACPSDLREMICAHEKMTGRRVADPS